MLSTRRWFLMMLGILFYPLIGLFPSRKCVGSGAQEFKTVFCYQLGRWERIEWDSIKPGDDLIVLDVVDGFLRECCRFTAMSSPSGHTGLIDVDLRSGRDLLYDGGLMCSLRS